MVGMRRAAVVAGYLVFIGVTEVALAATVMAAPAATATVMAQPAAMATATATESRYVSEVRMYYRNIDAGALDLVLGLFSIDAHYKRGVSFDLRGRDRIRAFYRNVRKLKGRHHDLVINGRGRDVDATGRFHGTSDGAPIALEFADLWRFNDDGKVSFRESWISKDGV